MVGKLTRFMDFLKRKLKPGQQVVLNDNPDDYSVAYLNKKGEPVIMGVTKCTFTFNRNCNGKTPTQNL